MKPYQLIRSWMPALILFLSCLIAADPAGAQFKDTFSDNNLYSNSEGTGNGFVSNGQGGNVYESGGYVTMSGSGYSTMVIRSSEAINPYQSAATTTTWKFGNITYDASWQRFWVGYRLNGYNSDHFYPDNPNVQGLYIAIVSNTGSENNYTYKGNLVANSGGSRTILASWNWSDLNQLSGLVVSLTTTATNYSLTFSGAVATPTYTFGSATGTLAGIGYLGNTYNVGVHNQAASGSSVQVDEIQVSSGVTTRAATAVTTAGATLNGTSFPAGLSTTAWFEYGTSPMLSGATSTTASSMGSGSNAVDYSQSVSGLSANTTYYFRAVENSSSGTRQGSILSFVTGPEIVVEHPVGTALVDGAATLNFSGSVGVAGSARTFTITNAGGVTLTGLSATLDGSYPGDYALTTLSTSTLAPGASTTLTVTFTAGALGDRGAVLHIASDDADENPFDITLNGKGVSAVPGYVWSGNTYYNTSATNSIWGSQFTAVDDCTLTHLGVYDHNQDGLSQAIPVGLWEVSTQQLLASTTVGGGTSDPLFGSCRQHALDTPVVLQAGRRYAVAAFYPSNSTDAFGQSTPITVDERVSFYGYAYYFSSQLTFPYYNGTGSSSYAQYFGANFMLDTTPAAPTVSSRSPVINDAGVTLRARVNPNSRATTVTFEYSLDPTLSSGVTTTAEQNLAAGSSGQNVSSSAISSLTPDTTYYVRAVAVNTLGTTRGVIRSFRTSPPVPGYKLNGNANTYVTQYYNGNNWGSYFTTTKACSLTHLGVYDYNQDGLTADTPVGIWDSNGNLLASTTVRSGTTDQRIGAFRYRQLDASVDLAANTRYYIAAYYAAYSSDIIGVDANMETDHRIVYEGTAYNYSSELSFPTSTETAYKTFARHLGASFLLESPFPEAPSVVTSSAGVNGTEVTFNATVKPNGLSTEVSFQYSLDPAMSSGVFTTSPQPLAQTGFEGVGVSSAAVSGLPAGTAYYVRATATNSLGTTNGEILPFNTTPSLAGIRWSGNMSYAFASSASPMIWGSTFTALEDSVLTHLGVYDHNQDGLSGSVPVGLWNYSTQQLIASVTVAPSDPLVGSSRQHVLSTPVTLTAGTRYTIGAYYAAYSTDAYGHGSPITTDFRVAYNGYAYRNNPAGLSYPDNQGDATLANPQYFGATYLLKAPEPTAPYVVTASPSVSESGVVLKATVRTNGLPTQVSFEYSLDSSLSSGVTTTAPESYSAGFDNLSVNSATITGLPAFSTYYVRVVAVNSLGTTVGAIRAFSTSPPVPGYKFSGNTGGYQTQPYWYDSNFGSYFTTAKACSLTHLGVYDHNQDGLAADIPVGIWDSNGTLLASTIVRSGTTDDRVGSFRYRQLPAPVSLAADTRYFIAAYYAAGAQDQIGYGSSIQTDHRINYEGYAYGNYSGQLSFPGWYSYGSTSATYAQYFGANILIEAPLQEAPAVVTSSAGVTGTEVSFNATVTPNGLSTQVSFEYSLDPAMSSGVVTTASQTLTQGGYLGITVNGDPITGLPAGTTYYVRAVATNSKGTSQGEILPFNTTPSIAGIRWSGNMQNASTDSSNRMWGSTFTAQENCVLTHLGVYDHNQDGLSRSVPVGLWDYNTQQLLASVTVAPSDPLVGSSRQHVLSTPVTLTAGVRYVIGAFFAGNSQDAYGYSSSIAMDYRVAYDGFAISYGINALSCPNSFGSATVNNAQYFGATFLLQAPSPAAPYVLTASPAVDASGAVLKATVRSNGLPTQVSFEYSLDNTLSSGVTTTASQLLLAGYDNLNVSSATITGLPANSTFYVRAVAVNSLGTTVGAIRAFSTSPPVPGYKFSGNTTNYQTQYYYDNNWGSYFTATKACALTHLGVYDHDQNGLGADIPVGIWDSNGTLLGSTTVRSGTTDERIGSFRYRQLDSPVSLAANTRYFVAAYYTSYAPDPIGYGVNLQTDSRIVYEGYTYNYYAGGLSFPGWYTYSTTSASSAQYFGAGFLLEAPSPAAPVVTTLEANVDPLTSAAPAAKVLSNGLPTQLSFEYSLDASLATGVSTTPVQNLPASYDPATLYAAPIYGLADNSTYYYRAVVTNSLGTAQGAVLSFKTNPLLPGYKYGSFNSYGNNPGYTWGSEFTALTNTSVTHLGVFDHEQNGLSGDVIVGLWDTNGNLLASTTVTSSDSLVGTSRYHVLNTPVALTANTRYLVGAYYTAYDPMGYGAITSDSRVAYYGYAYDTSYYYSGLRYPQYRGQTGDPNYSYYFGANFLLETPGPQAPTVSTRRAFMKQGAATMTASVMPGLQTTQVWFEYSTDSNLSTGVSSTAAQTVIGYNPKSVASLPVQGLPENTKIYYRAVASNSLGTSYGDIGSFNSSGALWNGPPMTFAKAPYSDWTQAVNQDRLTANTWLTRASTQGLFNIAQQNSYVSHTSPSNTEWAAGTLADFANLKFDTWYNWWGRNLSVLRGTNAVLHLINEDIYINIKFDTWTQASGGGFSYTRSTPGDTAVLTSPKIVLSGNGAGITNGDSTPSTADHTDFGSIAVADGTVTRTFTITNSGDGALNLTGTAPSLVTLSGTNASDFSVTAQPTTPVAANGGTTTFQVSFDPSAIGTRTAVVSIASDDSTANPFTFMVQGAGLNSAPTDVTLTPSSLAENNAANATVGTLAAVDLDVGQTHAFTLVAGTGDTDNGSFSISGTSLMLGVVANYEVKSSYSIRVQADDGNGGTCQKALTVSVTDVNEAPTDITLTPSSIAENNAMGATLGALAAQDEDAGQTHSFSLVAGSGDGDNGSFSISGSSLRITQAANFEVKSSYSIRVQADDGNGGTLARAFTVSVTDVNEAPVITSNGGLATAGVNVAENTTAVTQVSAVDVDLPAQFVSYSLGGVDAALFTINAGTGVLAFTASPDYETPLDQNADNTYLVTVIATDNGSPAASSGQQIAITVTDVPEFPEITVLGNGIEIVSGNAAPSTLDGTDFGNVLLTTPVSHEFTISNTDIAALNLTGTPLVEISGDHASNFAVTVMPSAVVSPVTGRTSFTIRFLPTGSGLRTALVTLRSNDPNEGVYTFAIQGTGYSNNAGRVYFASSGYVVKQGSTQVVLTINRADGKAATSVRLTTTPGTAGTTYSAGTAGVDYVHQDVVVNFAENATSQQVTIPLIARSGLQPNYQFSALLSNPGARTLLGSPSKTDISINAYTRPVVVVATPKQDAVINATAPYKVGGVVADADQAGINRVEVTLNGGAPVNATLTGVAVKSWSLDVTPVNGTNTLQMTAYDNRGIPSLPVSVNFTFARRYVLGLVSSPKGTVTTTTTPVTAITTIPGSSNKAVDPGANVLLKAVPKAGAVFSHWTGLPAGAVVNSTSASFIMPSQDVLGVTAVFVTNPFETPNGKGSTFYGFIKPASASQNSVNTLAFLTGTMTSTGSFSGKLLTGGLTKTFTATFYGNGTSTFSLTLGATTSQLTLGAGRALTLAFASGAIQATITAPGGISSTGVVRRIEHSNKNLIPVGFRNSKSSAAAAVNDRGYFTLAMPSKVQVPARALSTYPQGDGFGSVSMDSLGLITYAGTLADGSTFTASTGLVAGNQAPFMAQMTTPGATSKLACLGGVLAFDTTPGDSDVTATDLIWIRPSVTQSSGSSVPALATQLYTSGWPNGISLDAIGSLYSASRSISSSLGLGAAHATNGNGELDFSAGKLHPAVAITQFNIVGNGVTKIPATNTTFTLTLVPGSNPVPSATAGTFSGAFTPNWSGASAIKPAFKGIILQKGSSMGGYGFFISNRSNDLDPESGRVTLGAP